MENDALGKAMKFVTVLDRKNILLGTSLQFMQIKVGAGSSIMCFFIETFNVFFNDLKKIILRP